ncbi:hypothetical protein F2Q68_00010413 [Brassica cretica]|uniref:Uncharacterized protein n=1 Tax=Brassica cretica TaxID=69181 RepID=A0A8S9KUM5_BRACR|nr:hypothetical protein F2Q68_00010413 [Brassica cretica]
MNSLSSDIFPEINPFIKLRIDGIIWIASIKGSRTVRVRDFRSAFASRNRSGIGRTASAGCSGLGELVPTVGSLSFSAVGVSAVGPVVSSAFSSLCYDGLIATHMLAHAYRYLT